MPMILYISLFALIALIIIKSLISTAPSSDVVLNIRKNQVKFRENPLKKKIEEGIEKKAKITSKYTIETLCVQAGYSYSYGEYKMLCIIFALAAPLLLLLITPNYPLALIVSVVAYKLPKSMLKSRRKKRIEAMDKQVGAFLDIITERYKNNPDLCQNIVESLDSFKGQQPFVDELEKVTKLINYSGYSPIKALDELVHNTGNRYLRQFKDSYEISQKLPSDSSKEIVLSQAKKLYETDYKLRTEMKEKISGPVNNSYFILACIPLVMVYNAYSNPDYINFILNDSIGQGGLCVTVVILLLGNWVIQAKVNAPLIDE